MKQFSSSIKYLQSQLFIDQRFPYTSDDITQKIASYIEKLFVGATVWNNRLQKLDAACLVFKTLTTILLI